MAGRGLSLKALLDAAKKKESDKKKEKDDASEVRSEVNAPSVAASLTPSTGTIITAGRGRGIIFPSLMPMKPANSLPSNASIASSSQEPSRVPLLMKCAGRGMFSNTLMKPPHRDNSDPLASGSSAPDSQEVTAPYATSGIISGRGLSASSDNRTPSDANRASQGASRGASNPSSTGATPKVVAQPEAEPEPVDLVPVDKRGKKGMEFPAVTNAIQLHCDPSLGVFEYEVRFSPQVDSMQFRYKYMTQHKEFLGNARTFDGVILFLPKRLPEATTTLVAKNIVDESDVQITIIFKRQKRLSDCIQLYNVLFDRIFKVLEFLRVGRKCFDPTSPQMIPRHKLEVWPGYVKSVEELEGGLMLTLDVSHRVLATRTVLESMTEAYRANPNRYKDDMNKLLIGKMVITRYNNKTYRIDDVAYDKSPRDTFDHGGVETSYIDYYKSQYNIVIKDDKQPLLISRKEVRISGEAEKREYVFCLIPEICYLTGLTDQMRSNFTAMKDLAAHTKLSPHARVGSYKKFLDNVNNNPIAKGILSDWGLRLDSDPSKVTARLMDEEKIIFGRGKSFGAGPQADFNRQIMNNEVLEPIDINNWLLVYVANDKSIASSLEENMKKVCGPTGIRVAQPRRVELQNDRTESYISAIRKELDDTSIQIVVMLFPTMRDDRYAALKRVLCTEIPIPSQAINSKTLKNEAKNRSIVLKILLQMNCKLGGTLWGIKIPLPKTMICGIDTYHEAGHKGITVGGFVASLNSEFTHWWSKPTIQEKREELVNGLIASMEAALTAFKSRNGYYPDRVIMFRDGVGDGQLPFVQTYEVPQIKQAFKRVDPECKPHLTFVIVQKRINSKFFRSVPGKDGAESLVNPPPGSILDHNITSRYLYDYYIVTQHVREGTSTPSHYIVLDDENNFDPDILQRLTYKLCYLYYNWPGTVRVPAPCQYAHKLADLVGMNIKRQVAEKLNHKLYYL